MGVAMAAGFAEGDLRSEISFGKKMMCPMAWASERSAASANGFMCSSGRGHKEGKQNRGDAHVRCLFEASSVCEWLFEVRGRGQHQGDQVRQHSHVDRLPRRTPVGVRVAVRGGRGEHHHRGEQTRLHPHGRRLAEGHPSVCEWLYEGAPRTSPRTIKASLPWPSRAQGYLSICNWLYEAGAAKTITKANIRGAIPMYIACSNGHLSVCKWLLEVGGREHTKANDGASPHIHRLLEEPSIGVQGCSREKRHHKVDNSVVHPSWLLATRVTCCVPVAIRGGRGWDITTASTKGRTPMLTACVNGQLGARLFEVGAAKDITKADNDGKTLCTLPVATCRCASGCSRWRGRAHLQKG